MPHKRIGKLEKRIIARNQERNIMMERVAGLSALDRIGQSSEAQFYGFMAIFHPNYSDDLVRDIAKDLKGRTS